MSRVISYLFVGLLMGFNLSGCNKASAADGKENEREKVHSAAETEQGRSPGERNWKTINVEVKELAPASLTEFVVAHGVTRAIRDITYSAELSGRVEFLSAKLGDKVKRGQTLARIDFKTLKAQANQAEVNFDLAQKTHERLAALQDEDLVSQQKLDEVHSKMLSTKAGLDIARANVDKSTVVATYGGVVGARYVERGEYVGPGTALFHVVDYSTIIVEAQIPETQVARLKKGANVDVEIGALKEHFQGTVDAILPAADNVSKTFRLRIKINNKEMKILVGMSAKVRIATEKMENVVVVSHSSIIEEKEGRSVFVAKDGKAEKRDVKLGAMEGDRVVISDGVSFGEKLIIVGQRELNDGQPIQIIR